MPESNLNSNMSTTFTRSSPLFQVHNGKYKLDTKKPTGSSGSSAFCYIKEKRATEILGPIVLLVEQRSEHLKRSELI